MPPYQPTGVATAAPTPRHPSKNWRLDGIRRPLLHLAFLLELRQLRFCQPFLVGLAGDPHPGVWPVDDPAPDHHHPPELAGGAHPPPPSRPTLPNPLHRLERRVVTNLLPVRARRRIRVVEQWRAQRADGPGHLDRLVHQPVAEAPRPAPE